MYIIRKFFYIDDKIDNADIIIDFCSIIVFKYGSIFFHFGFEFKYFKLGSVSGINVMCYGLIKIV